MSFNVHNPISMAVLALSIIASDAYAANLKSNVDDQNPRLSSGVSTMFIGGQSRASAGAPRLMTDETFGIQCESEGGGASQNPGGGRSCTSPDGHPVPVPIPIPID